jgi:integrase
MPTINLLLDRYVAEELHKLSERTQIDYARHIKLLRKTWGEREADSLKPMEVGRFMDVQKGRISKGKVISVLANCYRLAVGKWFLVENNPTRDVMMPKGNRRTRYVTDAEYEAMRSSCPPRIQVAMDLALLTGQRQGDILAMDWDYVSIKDRVWYLRQGKTGKAFGIAITPALEAVMVRARRFTPAFPCQYVLRTRTGDRYSSEGFRSLWNRRMKAAVAKGLLKEPFTYHDLRAKCASDSASVGDASKLLGHADERITKAVYDRSIRIVQPLR